MQRADLLHMLGGVGDSTGSGKARVGEKTSVAKQKVVLKDNNIKNVMPKINKILEVYLSLDESMVSGDKIV